MSKNKKHTTNYPVGDFLIQIKNAALAGNKKVSVRSTKLIHAVAKALEKESYLQKVSLEDDIVTVSLTFIHKEPALLNLKLVSRPGLRTYMNVDELESYRGPETLIVSTSNGVMSHKDAIKARVGGEVIVRVW